MDQGVDKDSICQACGKNELVFPGPNTTEHLCQWLFSGETEEAVVIAQNFKGYDSLPMLGYLYQNGVKPTIIANGAKNMHIEVPRYIRMIDSINFKMFGLEELKKGYFPHRKENQSVVLNHLPDVHYYNPDIMSLTDRTVCFVWYETNYRQRFDFQRELLSYSLQRGHTKKSLSNVYTTVFGGDVCRRTRRHRSFSAMHRDSLGLQFGL
jgi:hypothetical protein